MSKPISEYSSKHSSGSAVFDPLPLMHSCDCFAGRSIIENNELKATQCKVFRESLLYFFYGKPSYQVSEGVKGNFSQIEYCPICFIFPLDKITIDRVFPFDTGAYNKKLYKNFFHKKMKKEDFEMDNTREGISQYIEVFYGNNDNYIEGDSQKHKDTGDPYVNALDSLHGATGMQEFDDRAITIEVITRHSVPVDINVECIILPNKLMLNDNISEFITNHNIHYIEYKIVPGIAPSKDNAVVMQKALEYLDERKGSKS